MSIIKKVGGKVATLYYKLNKEAYRVKKWEQEGKKGPPPHSIKEKSIMEFQKRFNLPTMIETGTFMGDMVEAMKNNFRQIYSIELDEKLFKAAQKRFESNKHIKILQGDSSEELAKLLQDMNTPCLFWLDGHYSEGVTAKGELVTPIRKELSAIADNRKKFGHKHVILIDDARLFNGKDDYPTIEEVRKRCSEYFPDYDFAIKDDNIRLSPKN